VDGGPARGPFTLEGAGEKSSAGVARGVAAGYRGASRVGDAANEAMDGSDTAHPLICRICGYLYDPARGDPEHGVVPGTPFERLPASWRCPVCGATQEDFAPPSVNPPGE
jgi:rubredoxin